MMLSVVGRWRQMPGRGLSRRYLLRFFIGTRILYYYLVMDPQDWLWAAQLHHGGSCDALELQLWLGT